MDTATVISTVVAGLFWVGVVIYMLKLATRLVRAVERIADNRS